MVYFVYNGYGYHAGHHFTFGWADDNGAKINYTEFGWVEFGSSGYGENDKVRVQLAKEYGRYFCSTAICGGFSNWISGNVEYFIVKVALPTITDFKAYLQDSRVIVETTFGGSGEGDLRITANGVEMHVGYGAAVPGTTYKVSLGLSPGTYEVCGTVGVYG